MPAIDWRHNAMARTAGARSIAAVAELPIARREKNPMTAEGRQGKCGLDYLVGGHAQLFSRADLNLAIRYIVEVFFIFCGREQIAFAFDASTIFGW